MAAPLVMLGGILPCTGWVRQDAEGTGDTYRYGGTITLPDMVKLADIAKRLRLDVSTVRRLVAKHAESLQLSLHRGKHDHFYLSPEDAEKVIASYEARRGQVAEISESVASAYDPYGYFYVMQLVPEALPDRVKIGFTDNVEKRLAEHRTAAPTARLVKAWPCKRSWDFAAMDSITRAGCKLVLNEVYEGEVKDFIERGDIFFSVMPQPDSERELSEHSPLYAPGSQDEYGAEETSSGSE